MEAYLQTSEGVGEVELPFHIDCEREDGLFDFNIPVNDRFREAYGNALVQLIRCGEGLTGQIWIRVIVDPGEVREATSQAIAAEVFDQDEEGEE